DACDPRPATVGDYILQFEPHDDPTSTAYVRVSGAFAWQPDALRLGGLDSNFTGSADFNLASYPARIVVGTQVVDASSMEQWFGAWYNQHPVNEDPKVFLNGTYDPLSQEVEFSLKEQPTATQYTYCPDPAAGPPRFVAGDRYTLSVDTNLVTGGDHRITVTSATGTGSCTLTVSVPPYNRGFIEASYLIVDFEYLIAYGIR